MALFACKSHAPRKRENEGRRPWAAKGIDVFRQSVPLSHRWWAGWMYLNLAPRTFSSQLLSMAIGYPQVDSLNLPWMWVSSFNFTISTSKTDERKKGEQFIKFCLLYSDCPPRVVSSAPDRVLGGLQRAAEYIKDLNLSGISNNVRYGCWTRKLTVPILFIWRMKSLGETNKAILCSVFCFNIGATHYWKCPINIDL